jgi:hypothetical protein
MANKGYFQKNPARKPTAYEIKKATAVEKEQLKAEWALATIIAFEDKPLIQKELCKYFGFKSLADAVLAKDNRGK